MPLSKPPPTISLHPPTTPFITATAPLTSPLTSTPPELLLAIISFLPPTALYPLSLTSHHLHTFLHTHAASICNTFILTHHSHASSILQNRFTDGWLLPTHAAILNEESRILRDVVLGSGCKCGGCRVALSTTSPNASILELVHEQGDSEDRLMNSLSTLLPQTCKAKTALDAYLRLSSPGPQYLVFLEKYSWEIVTRYSMGSFASSPSPSPLSTSTSTSTSTTSSQPNTATPSPTSSTRTAAATEDQETTEREQREREKQEATFAFMIGNYCVRRFLDSASKLVSSIPSPAPSSSRYPSYQEKSPRMAFMDTSRRLGRKLKKRMGKVEKQVEIRESEVEVEVEVEEVILDRDVDEVDGRERTASLQGTTPRRMMFGEISPASSHLGVDEKSLLATQKKKRGERWEDGLLWYYGVPSLRAPSHETREEQDEVEEVEIEEKGRKERGCIAVFKRGLGVIGRRVRGMFLGRCVGMRRVVGVRGFRALEG